MPSDYDPEPEEELLISNLDKLLTEDIGYGPAQQSMARALDLLLFS